MWGKKESTNIINHFSKVIFILLCPSTVVSGNIFIGCSEVWIPILSFQFVRGENFFSLKTFRNAFSLASDTEPKHITKTWVRDTFFLEKKWNEPYVINATVIWC